MFIVYMYKHKTKPGHLSRTKKVSNTIKRKSNYTKKMTPKYKPSKKFLKHQTLNKQLNSKLFIQLKQNINKPPIPPTIGAIINKYIPLMKNSLKKKQYVQAAKYNYLILAAIATYVPVNPIFDKGTLVEHSMGPILSNADTHIKYHTGYAYPKQSTPIKFTRKERRKLQKQKTRKRNTQK